MQKIFKYLSWLVILLFFALGIWILIAPRYQYLPKSVKVIFALFLFLYGAYRMARLWTKSREEDDE